jgi:transcriptional regulator EpsA
MRVDGLEQLPAPYPSWPGEELDSAPERDAAAASSARLGPLDLESLALNLDASLNVRARHQFFAWTQGVLQSLLAHELLVCTLRNDRSAVLCVDSFSSAPVEPVRLNELFRSDVSLVPALLRLWEENHCQPVAFDAAGRGDHAGSVLARELERLGATSIVAHGTHDADGQVASLFTFASRPGTLGRRQLYLAEMVVPFLHAAWMRTQVNWQAKSPGAKQAEDGLVTSRELEVLGWMYRGKSNIEIGMILGISPLTVKNHVQKILRKLDVLNRTQAVGKALALRILST